MRTTVLYDKVVRSVFAFPLQPKDCHVYYLSCNAQYFNSKIRLSVEVDSCF